MVTVRLYLAGTCGSPPGVPGREGTRAFSVRLGFVRRGLLYVLAVVALPLEAKATMRLRTPSAKWMRLSTTL